MVRAIAYPVSAFPLSWPILDYGDWPKADSIPIKVYDGFAGRYLTVDWLWLMQTG